MERSPLAVLPPELRNRIYELVLIEPNPITVSLTQLADLETSWQPPHLLQTCRQINAEATAIYYSGKTFTSQDTRRVDCEDALFLWFFGLSKKKQAMVRQTRLEVGFGRSDSVKANWKLATHCRALLRDADVAISPHLQISVQRAKE